MQPLQLVTYLGDNTVVIAEGLAGHLSAAGYETVVHPATTWQARHEAILTGAPDIYWMCGLLTVELIDSEALPAEIVAAPVFDGQLGPLYHSVIVSTTPAQSIDDLAGRRLVINETGSWSGNHALRVHLAESSPGWRPGSVIESGGHETSIDMLLAGQAEVASIDHTIWEHRLTRDVELTRLHVVRRTRDWPAPPISLHRRIEATTRERIVDALSRAVTPGLTRIVPADDAVYDLIRQGMATSRLAWELLPRREGVRRQAKGGAAPLNAEESPSV